MPLLYRAGCRLRLFIVALGCGAAAASVSADEPFIVVQSTTSTQNSGLYDSLLPMVREQIGVEVRVVAVGTGQALRNAENCDGDVLLVHATPAEEAFVEAGHGVSRTNLMYNDFVIVGPADDPAGIRASVDAASALQNLATTKSLFVSRGDDSGTHKAEMALWQAADVDPTAFSGQWYRETGSGMGATLNVASGMNAYTLTDRASWLTFQNKGSAAIVLEGDPGMFNQYGVILVNPDKCGNVKHKPAQAFVDWLLSDAGQQAIDDFRIGGEQLFFGNAP